MTVDAVPYTPARHFAKGKGDPGFRTKLAIGADLAIRARAAGFAFCAVCADSAYGDQDGFRGELAQAGLPFVRALKPRRAPGPTDRTLIPRWTRPGSWPGAGRRIR
jgi:SRSO17 transposase